MADRVLPGHDINLVLDDDHVLEANDIDGCEVLPGLRLGAALVGSDDQYGAVHDGCAAEHRRHEDLVARGVHETDGPLELRLVSALRA